MYNTRVRFACLIYFSRDQSSSKLIIFLDSKLERSNSLVAKINSRLDSRNFQGSRIESRVEFRNSRVTVNLPLSGTVYFHMLKLKSAQLSHFHLLLADRSIPTHRLFQIVISKGKNLTSECLR